jgi:hypothetical protein
MVLGDSLTWGPGLAPEQRFTERSEVLLRRRFPGREISRANISPPLGPTWPTRPPAGETHAATH